MADISMCMGVDCPIKEKCYRFKAVPNPYRQTYLVQDELIGDYKNGKCTEFCER